jgi:hypothetical protein
MTAPRRFLLLLTGLAVGPIPACLSISTVTEPPVVRTAAAGEFATLPKGPGKVVPINPVAKANPSSTTKPPAAKLPPPIPPTETVDPETRPASAQTANHGPPPKPEPVASQPAPGPVTPARAEAPVLPVLTPQPGTTEPPLLAAMRAYVENRPEDALRHLQSLSRPNQEFALAVMPLLLRGSQANLTGASPDDVAALVDQLQGVAGRLERKAALRVDKVVFCRKVIGFGRYDPWPEAQPYRPNDLAVLYVEMRNVGSEPIHGPNGEGYLSRAAVSLEVRDAAGRLVEQTDPADWRRRVPVARFEHTDHTRSALRDYSRTYRISVPSQAGVYTVTVVVTDPAANRTARSQPVRFDVGGP